jgi:hypothetical protein
MSHKKLRKMRHQLAINRGEAVLAALVCACLLGGYARATHTNAIEDYYSRLGVLATATQKEIKQAYHQMSIK